MLLLMKALKMKCDGCTWKIEMWEGEEQSVCAVILVSGCRQRSSCEGQIRQKRLRTYLPLE